MNTSLDPLDALHREAYAAFDRGALAEALPRFLQLAQATPRNIVAGPFP